MAWRHRASRQQRGYDRAWERLRKAVLADDPLCRMCFAHGRVTPAQEVDHIEPISRRPELRLDRGNLQPICRPCHRRKTAVEGTRGERKGCDIDGLPLDPSHHWREP